MSAIHILTWPRWLAMQLLRLFDFRHCYALAEDGKVEEQECLSYKPAVPVSTRLTPFWVSLACQLSDAQGKLADGTNKVFIISRREKKVRKTQHDRDKHQIWYRTRIHRTRGA